MLVIEFFAVLQTRETCKLAEVTIPKNVPGIDFHGSFPNAYLVHVKNDKENIYEIIIMMGGKVFHQVKFSLLQLDIDFSALANKQVRMRDGIYTNYGPFFELTFAGEDQVKDFRKKHDEFKLKAR